VIGSASFSRTVRAGQELIDRLCDWAEEEISGRDDKVDSNDDIHREKYFNFRLIKGSWAQ